MNLQQIKEKNDYERLDFIGLWNGYNVYKPTRKKKLGTFIGYPLRILEKDGQVRFCTFTECLDILRQFKNQNK